MGCTASTETAAGASTTAKETATQDMPPESAPKGTTSSNQNETTKLEEVQLKKRRPECTGMFWRSDPTGATMLLSNDHWPRDNAKLRGYAVVVDEEKWLICTHVQQEGESTWHEAPEGAAMPYVYYDHYYLE